MDMLTRQLGKSYEQRLLNYLLHRRENRLLEVNLRHVGKEFGWTGKTKYIRQALEDMAAQGKVKRIVYQTGIIHWAIADKTVHVRLMDKNGHEWTETSAIPAWLDVNEWGLSLVKTFNHDLNMVQKPVKLIKAEVL